MISPEALAIGPDGQIYFSDCPAQRVFRLGTDGRPTVVAGSGPQGLNGGSYSGDGGPAVEARINCPSGLAFDAHGDLLVADSLNNRVRMIDTSGVISTVVGSGPTGLTDSNVMHDGGPATKGLLAFPVGLAFDRSGDLFISDKGHDAIRRVNPRGIITTVAGTGVGGYSGDGGPATKAQLHGPWYIAIDAHGDILFTENENDLLRKVDPHGMITTVAAGFEDAYGLALDAAGNMYVSDDQANVIRKIDTHGVISTVAGTGKAGRAGDGGPAIDAQLNSPFGLLVDPSGDVLIADGGNGCVRKIDPQGVIDSVACASG